MKQYLIEIKQLLKNKENVITYEGLTSSVTMSISASDTEILDCEKKLTTKIPEDYIFFLKHYNGGIIFKIEDFAGFKLFDTNELFKENTFQKENFEEDWSDEVLLFCLCIGDNEYLGFKKEENSYKIVHCIMELLPKEWLVVANNFDDFLLRLIKEGGRKYWLD